MYKKCKDIGLFCVSPSQDGVPVDQRKMKETIQKGFLIMLITLNQQPKSDQMVN